MRKVTTGLFFMALAGCASLPPVEPMGGELEWTQDQAIALEGGKWFDGRSFRTRNTTYIVDGRLTDRRPSKVDRRIDLTGKFVMPPFGDAHTHGFDGPYGLPAQRAAGLDAGVFYAMTMTAPSSSVSQIRTQLSGPRNVDVATAMGGITGPRSHPAEIYEATALGFYSYEQQLANADAIHRSRKFADDAYYVVESRDDVDRKWPMIAGFDPDFIKVYLRSSETFGQVEANWGAGGGIDPKLLPYIVDKAHASGRRVAVAVSSRYDFLAAAQAGAEMATHPPCYQDASAPGPYQDFDSEEECRLLPSDLAAAEKAGLATILIATEWTGERPEQLLRWEQANVADLAGRGLPLAVGSNAYGTTMVPGVIAGMMADLYPRADILRWATTGSARLAFPDRRAGCLERGCEASFLVLADDPLTDPRTLGSIQLRIKDGLVLLPRHYAVPPRTP